MADEIGQGTIVLPLTATDARGALDHVADAVFILDSDRTIAYANPAASRLTGLSMAAVEGAGPSIVLSSAYEAADLIDLEAALAAGTAWAQTVPSLGGMHSLSLDPLAPEQGGTTPFVLVVRDLSVPRLTESEQARLDEDRSAVLSILGEFRPAGTIEDTSYSLCQVIAGMNGFDGAMILMLPPTGDLVHVSNVGPALPGFEYGARIPFAQLEDVMHVTSNGPWYLDLGSAASTAALGPELVAMMMDAGITGTAYAAMRYDGTLTGVLAVASTAPHGGALMAGRLGVLEHLAAAAGTILGNQAVEFGRAQVLKAGVARVIASRSFHSVLQPIVRLEDGAVLGHEALTRFDDGRPPDQHFADAHEAGLGTELEQACVQVALDRVRLLPPEHFISVNYSPGAVVSGEVGRTLQDLDREVIVEITEHSVIPDYAAVRAALTHLPHVRLAVDDAGAGFASLRHILELRPDFVKLDIGLVRGVNADPARAAMVAGVCHFASVTGTRLIAEGVETQAEADSLRVLGVELAQGYLFGRPE